MLRALTWGFADGSDGSSVSVGRRRSASLARPRDGPGTITRHRLPLIEPDPHLGVTCVVPADDARDGGPGRRYQPAPRHQGGYEQTVDLSCVWWESVRRWIQGQEVAPGFRSGADGCDWVGMSGCRPGLCDRFGASSQNK